MGSNRRRGHRGTESGDRVNAVLELDDIGKEYDGPPTTRALLGINLTVDTGEYVGIVGPSGSGKSTLLNLLGALDRPSEGTLRIDGYEVNRLSDKRLSALRGRRLGFVFQTFNLIDGLDAADNVELGLLYAGAPKRHRRRRALEALERVGLAQRASHRPSRLSGGERQRVAIARALVSEPALLLADEPTGNLDTTNGQAILRLFADLHRDGATIVLITHDSSIVDTLPRHVTIRDGRIVHDTNDTP
jgi:putative ABC transport system ATP-binding protein